MRKVVYNACYGGFSLSEDAVRLGRELSRDERWGGIVLKGDKYDNGEECLSFHGGYLDYDTPRHDEILVQVVEKLGSEKASGSFAKLKIAEIEGPYRIDEYDGFESVETPDSYDWVE